ncbi:MAG: L,D-transpeptidase [Defluviimonas sp.]|nr:L,D-transpeptidase [Defluviimonas sp.]
MLTRRSFTAFAACAGLAACSREPLDITSRAVVPPSRIPPLPAHYGAIPGEPFPVPAVPEGVVPERLWRQDVANPWPELPEGMIVVDPAGGLLYLVKPNGRALRYGVGTGRAAFSWSGDARLQFRRKWPRWNPPDEMVARDPRLEPFSIANGGMDPGPGNPLGARALYLFQNGVDTLYRIHGACEPEYLGEAVSSGCIRMLDQDVIDLHDRVRDGVPVRVLTPPQSHAARIY